MASIRLPEAMETRLEALAKATRRSKSFYVKEALTHYLEDMEDAYMAQDRKLDPNPVYYTTQEVLKRLRAKPKKK
jgi:RHH-type rel operon transcriptional repressor/antitoxin RelB